MSNSISFSDYLSQCESVIEEIQDIESDHPQLAAELSLTLLSGLTHLLAPSDSK